MSRSAVVLCLLMCASPLFGQNPVNLDPAGLAGRCEPVADTIVRPAGNAVLVSEGCWGWTRLLTVEEAEQYFGGGFGVGQVVALGFNGDDATIYGELASDNLWFNTRLGYSRVGVGALVGASQDDTESTVNQLFEAGGNIVGFLSLPLYGWINTVKLSTSSADQRVLRRVDTHLHLSVRGDVPEMNAAVDNPAASMFAGLRAAGITTTVKDVMQIHGGVDAGLVWGSEKFRENLNLTDEPAVFGTLKLSAGIDIDRRIRISASRGMSWIDDIATPWSLRVQMLSRREDD